MAKGYIHSLQSLGTVDGPGVRAVVFASGCPLRCEYCHNPDTWCMTDGTLTDSEELGERIFRLYPYIKNGGVTFSGGEPLMQSEFFSTLAKKLKEKGLHIALDTCGYLLDDSAKELLSYCDLVLLDLKFNNETDYKRYTGGSFAASLAFLEECERQNKKVWIRRVVGPSLTDSSDSVRELKAIVSTFKCVEKIELLPFRKLCLEKYEGLGISFPLKDTPECKEETIKELYEALEQA